MSLTRVGIVGWRGDGSTDWSVARAGARVGVGSGAAGCQVSAVLVNHGLDFVDFNGVVHTGGYVEIGLVGVKLR